MTLDRISKLLILTIFVSIFLLNPKLVFAQRVGNEPISPEVKLQLVPNDDSDLVEIAVSLTHGYDGRKYEVTISHPEFLDFTQFEKGGFNCAPEVVQDSSSITLYCSLPEGYQLDKRGTLGTVLFTINGSGTGDIRVDEASVDDLYVKGSDLQIEVNYPEDQEGFLTSTFNRSDLVLWFGLVAMLSGALLLLYVRHKKNQVERSDQLVFLSLVGLVVISTTGAFVTAMDQNNFSYSTEAYVDICERECNEKDCGVDGCGGYCGVCDSGYMCTEDGKCEVDGEPDVQGVSDSRTSIPSDAKFGDLDYDGYKDLHDYSILLNAIMKWEREGIYIEKADLDRDEQVNLKDLYLFTKIIYE